MADHSGTIRVRELFESAFQAYEKEAGVTLIEHPLAIQLQSCDSVECITALLQAQAQAFGESPGIDKVMKPIRNTVTSLTRLSATASLTLDMSLVR
jgi:hypothetical protein